MAACTAKVVPNTPKSESITDGWTDGPANCHTLLSYFGITNNRPFYLIDRHSFCIDSDLVERKAFFMEVI